jgi:hypothetical protein
MLVPQTAKGVFRMKLWSLKSAQLEQECRLIADGKVAAASESLQTEARQLAEEWREAIKLPQNKFDDQARRAARILALRRRTIEILIKMAPKEETSTRAR